MKADTTAQKFIDFNIIQSSVDNGRIYFDSVHTDFFPADALGGRGKGKHAPNTICIDVAGAEVETDIRCSSTVRISPRKSFKLWLRSNNATDGTKGRLYRLSERQYRLEYLG